LSSLLAHTVDRPLVLAALAPDARAGLRAPGEEGGVSGLTPTQRTLRALREQGRVCAIVERFNAYAGPHGVRQDLFGIIDVLALDPERGVVGIQSTGLDFAGHWRKLTQERVQEVTDWLRTPGTSLELWGWRKIKLHRGGKAERWQPRIRLVTLADIDSRAPVEELA
jgi:hypothetical protein